MALHCHNDKVITALVTTTSLIRGESEWINQMNSRTKGKSDIFLYTKRFSALEEIIVLSTPGNDNVSRIYFDDTQLHIVGLTEGEIMNPNASFLSNKLFFAGFPALNIISARSPEAAEMSGPLEILPDRDFAIQFSSLPVNRGAMSPVIVKINDVPCGNVRWMGEEIYALAPPGLSIDFSLSVEFNSYPYQPKVVKTVSLKRPSIINVVPNVTDFAPFTTVQFTVSYMGQTEFNDMAILIGNQRCEVQTAGVVPDFFVANNFTLMYRQLPQNVSITIDEGQETPIVLNCSAYANIFNSFQYRIFEAPYFSIGRLLFENKTELPIGNHINVEDNLGRLRFRSTSHGRVEFNYYCAYNGTFFSPILGTVVIDVRPVINCRNTVSTTGNFLLDQRMPTTASNVTYSFLTVPSWGQLVGVESTRLLNAGDNTLETVIRLTGRLAVEQSPTAVQLHRS
ncbi:hypothetical protein BKA69DRAFT_895761 [Paraphysoderma sedebokerense]|nr:hypothetical protein BKA69DRAFT_895761 [Paraphysoderma sedebokerense]